MRVNAVSPGPIETSMTSGVEAGPAEGQHFIETLLATMPLQRMGSPDEVAETAVFLATGASSFTTGAELFVDGGLAQV
ncbi:SDR family oxidoreductase [Actinopolymorpha sp. NPDC004070]|uniref:SDR family oxidoreductase n=1 Tax=Actinopolymorpha sp. NPDC004070 TaxID=3154548 RepID=UPI0033BDBC60